MMFPPSVRNSNRSKLSDCPLYGRLSLSLSLSISLFSHELDQRALPSRRKFSLQIKIKSRDRSREHRENRRHSYSRAWQLAQRLGEWSRLFYKFNAGDHTGLATRGKLRIKAIDYIKSTIVPTSKSRASTREETVVPFLTVVESSP